MSHDSHRNAARSPGALLSRVLLLAALLVGARPAQEPVELLHLVVLHTNDIHGQVLPLPATWIKDRVPPPTTGGLARIAGYVNRVRAEAEAQGAAVLVVDAGDWFQGTPEGWLDDGRAFLSAFAGIQHDAACVGNHEFDHGVETALAHLAAVPIRALLANAREPGGALLDGCEAYRVVDRLGLRIALVGLLSTATPAMSHPSTRSLDWIEPAEALSQVKRDLGGDVDWILPITHMGVNEDKDLARAHPDLDLIVGGHSHTVLAKGIEVGRTLVVQAGSKGRSVGRVDVWFDARTKRVTRREAQLVDLLDDPTPEYANTAVARACDELLERSAARMDEVVGRFEGPLERGRDPYRTSAAGNLITDVMRRHAGAHVALQNRGGIRADLDAGPVTRRDLFSVLPFDNALVTVTLNGAQLEALMRRSIEASGRSGLEFSGMTIELRRGGERPMLVGIEVDGEPLRADAAYDVATNDFLANGGDDYLELAQGRARRTDPILQRDLLEKALDGGTLVPPTENRYRVER